MQPRLPICIHICRLTRKRPICTTYYQFDNARRNSSTDSTAPKFASDADPEKNLMILDPLLVKNGGNWTLTDNGMGLERRFTFKTFKRTWSFMNKVAEECKIQHHHPEWSNVYNMTFIRWTTHSPPGLSEKDLLMAKYCDEQAVLKNIQAGKPVGVNLEKGNELADRVAKEAQEIKSQEVESQEAVSQKGTLREIIRRVVSNRALDYSGIPRIGAKDGESEDGDYQESDSSRKMTSKERVLKYLEWRDSKRGFQKSAYPEGAFQARSIVPREPQQEEDYDPFELKESGFQERDFPKRGFQPRDSR